ncbi:MAG TPA: hypothetical protein VGS12_11900 [Caulobacteraceae bacterium]|nr:hypothetical protein [Caulobacteraceae bacterium]
MTGLWRWLWIGTAAALAGCFSTHTENAKLQMPWPNHESTALSAYAKADPNWPSVGGDILKGASPTEQAAARDAADREAQARRKAAPPRPATPPPAS